MMSIAPSLPTARDIARTIASALADDRVRRHQNDLPAPTADEEHELARATASAVLARGRAGDGWGFDAIPDPNERPLIEEAIAHVLGLGPLESLLRDDQISDIHVRGNRPVWLRMRNGERVQRAPLVETDEELVALVRRIASRSGHREERFDPAHPEVNLQLPDGSRLFAAMEVSARPTMVIRRHRFDFSSLPELVQMRMVAPDVARFLAAAVRARLNIIVAGGTGSGKTTLLRALINEVPREERIVTIEDAFELGLEQFEDAHPDHDALQARSANIEGHGAVTMADLTRMALRMDPDRVVVGEVRGAEAFPMLLAMSQGNNGSMCTLHADSARSVFPKLVAYVAMSENTIPAGTVNMLMGSAIHLVVHLGVFRGARRVSQIIEVVDNDGDQIVANEVYTADGDGAFMGLRHGTAELLRGHGFDRSQQGAW